MILLVKLINFSSDETGWEGGGVSRQFLLNTSPKGLD